MSTENYEFFQNHISGKHDIVNDYAPIIDGRGDLTRISGINVLIHSLRTLLLTPLGHYPFDPEYGSLLYKKLFEPSDNITMQEIRYEIEYRVRRYDPRIKIKHIDLNRSPDKKTVVVNVHIKKDDKEEEVEILLSSQHTMFGIDDELTESIL